MIHSHRPAPSLHQQRGALSWRTLLEWLVEDGYVMAGEAAQLQLRLSAGSSSQHPLIRLGGAELRHARSGEPLDVEALTRWLAQRISLPYLRIDPLKVDVARVTEVMSAAYAEKRRVLPVQVGAAEVTIATAEPYVIDWVSEIAAHTRKTVRLVLANPLDIARYTTEFYSVARSVRAAQKTGETSSTVNFEQLVEMGKHKQLDANDQGVVQLVDWLWTYAFDQRASDIHLEPRRDQCVIRFRIDGVLHTVYQLPSTVMAAVTARIKLLGRMDVVERRRAQDGRIKTRSPRGDEIEMRLSTLPTAFGEKLVMRIFDPETAVKPVTELGFDAADVQRWRTLMDAPHGIVLVTGPTGSGKTTTLYATLKRLATDQVNVCTVEDPIEMIEPAFNQTQVQPALDLDFAASVRALMRQDPDIIMVGEIRDLETAEMAVQAALTGHLVFSTLHTNDSASAVTRLLDLGVPAYLINATLIGVLAQRLVRTLCPDCRQSDEALSVEALAAVMPGVTVEQLLAAGEGGPADGDEADSDALTEGRSDAAEPGRFRPMRPVGCTACRMTGYRGRSGLFELLTFDEGVRATITEQPDLARLRRESQRQGLTPLRLAGLRKVAQGLTTLDEVLRATPDFTA
ncbi:MAG TPA: ATPase, T2SS/T4P/T4SS family [Burkholderiaceae bacterium]|nr:ATPase, T2SS/T4P/T4SS family [Burkholderiaceae bacterium]HMX10154.1 ATPase, T2SS/T4P/T4SS family [Burkholderiaceae bacterium]HMY98948.1 ATPase, T2SS/T4P/T4SS family [Burkholderiaceae bacterium]HNB45770.1 ATPase, T2SS/T4P/T4SS family [Burkholderiaceae bacterium]HNG79279.1 ATPase, T2SS/T4P/T4SS family [Burkholderiaceae bacterium]